MWLSARRIAFPFPSSLGAIPFSDQRGPADACAWFSPSCANSSGPGDHALSRYALHRVLSHNLAVFRARCIVRGPRLRADRCPEQLAADTFRIECRRRISPAVHGEKSAECGFDGQRGLRRVCAGPYRRQRPHGNQGVFESLQGSGVDRHGECADAYRNDQHRQRTGLLAERPESRGQLRRLLRRQLGRQGWCDIGGWHVAYLRSQGPIHLHRHQR